MISGTLAAAATPLAPGGARVDEDGFRPLVDFLAGAGLDGLLALGTTGEGILLSVPERKRVTELFLEAAAGRLTVAAHCGAQTTADTVALAAARCRGRCRRRGRDRTSVLPARRRRAPGPFHGRGERLRPGPFYVYEFERTSGYAVPRHVIDELRTPRPTSPA